MHPSMERARRLSHYMQWFLVLIGALVIAATVYISVLALSEPGWIENIFAEKYAGGREVSLSGNQALFLIILTLAQVTIFCVALFALWRAFGTIARNEAINRETALWIRCSGIGFAATAVLMLLSHPLNSIIGSLGAAPGQKFLSVQIGTPELMTFLVSSVLIVFGHVIMLAAEISDDNNLIV